MKKRCNMLLACLACALLTACGAGGGAGQQGYDPALVQALVQAGAFSEELEELDGDTAFVLYRLAEYGFVREDLADCAVVRSAGATCEEGAVLVLSPAAQARVQDARQAIEDYVQRQIEDNRDYRPSEIPKLEQAMVSAQGATVLLVVAGDLQVAEAALEENT